MKKILFALLSLPLLGILFQMICICSDHYKYRPHGQLININGQRFHYSCIGQGNGTVVIDSGLGMSSLDWSLVQPKVAEFTRVFTYDRAGYGWSEENTKPRTSEHIVEELHDLLDQAKIPKPYILVGHSFGGLNMQLYFSKYPHEVEGIVLVDSSHPNQLEVLPPDPESSILEKHPSIHIFLANLGIIRFISWLPPVKKIIYETLQSFSIATQQTLLAQFSSAKYIRTFSRENSTFNKSLAQVKSKNISFGSTPLIIIRAGKESMGGWLDTQPELLSWLQQSASIWEGLQNDFLSKSTQSKLVIAEKSDHMIPRNQPEVIIEAVKTIHQYLNNKIESIKEGISS